MMGWSRKEREVKALWRVLLDLLPPIPVPSCKKLGLLDVLPPIPVPSFKMLGLLDLLPPIPVPSFKMILLDLEPFPDLELQLIS